MADDAIRLAVVDDQELVRVGIHSLLQGEDGINLVGEAKNGEEALSLARRLRPQVILVDVKLPDISGIEVVQRLKEDPETEDVQSIMLTVYDDLEIATEAIRAGAIGYILKDCRKEQLLEAIKSAIEGVPLVSSSISKKILNVLKYHSQTHKANLADDNALQELTEREYDVLGLVTKGYSNKSVAAELCITVSTVKTHLRNIYRKLGVEDRAQAIIKAIKEGIA